MSFLHGGGFSLTSRGLVVFAVKEVLNGRAIVWLECEWKKRKKKRKTVLCAKINKEKALTLPRGREDFKVSSVHSLEGEKLPAGQLAKKWHESHAQHERLEFIGIVLPILLPTLSWSNRLEIGVPAARTNLRTESWWEQSNEIFPGTPRTCRLAVWWTRERVFRVLLHKIVARQSHRLFVCQMQLKC